MESVLARGAFRFSGASTPEGGGCLGEYGCLLQPHATKLKHCRARNQAFLEAAWPRSLPFASAIVPFWLGELSKCGPGRQGCNINDLVVQPHAPSQESSRTVGLMLGALSLHLCCAPVRVPGEAHLAEKSCRGPDGLSDLGQQFRRGT